MRKIFIVVLSLFVFATQAPLHNMGAQQAHSPKMKMQPKTRLFHHDVQDLRGTVITTGPMQTQQIGT